MESQSSENCSRLAVPISDQDHALGPSTAPYTLVEYGDYECPDCLNAQPLKTELRARLGDRLQIVFRHFPQNSIHPRASAAAAAAEAAGTQGRFWEMHDLLFRHQKHLADADLTHLALRIGLEIYRFQNDIESPAHARKIRDDFDGGVLSGVRATPTFFINGCMYTGSHELTAMLEAIRKIQPA